ncbi:MAG: hypothetical protein A3D64_03235 [Candidatus Wildermuthbacteria bacterium RIFCSPHIGHO2_02_FULL_49_9]|uniref:Uncharacterized protein n=1 Tax=Candidatus Wildermuthbacteria bacterium RIFCSPHIGHO2_02_FULL_49_9 TaxID=1802456 RepID=A0A1G2RDA5_9BACT|nr:MAG: hypothetical protein A3D64_03235 [Candidatus Wildermuthbacteria bacterium RIFCSPHIGHO2_02_FULL_49_9]
MPTTKARINISVSEETREAIERLAKHEQKPVATKAANLLEFALEIEEDRYFEKLASEREKNNVRWLSHEEAWK